MHWGHSGNTSASNSLVVELEAWRPYPAVGNDLLTVPSPLQSLSQKSVFVLLCHFFLVFQGSALCDIRNTKLRRLENLLGQGFKLLSIHCVGGLLYHLQYPGCLLTLTILMFRWPCIMINSCNKTNSALISQIYFWNKTVHVSDNSSVLHQEFFTVHTTMVYVIQVFWQLASMLSANLYDIYHCCVYSEKLLMKDRGIVWNM